MSSFKVTTDVTIPISTSTSSSVDLGDTVLVGVITPAAWTAAAITFEASIDGTNWRPMRSSSAEVSIVTGQISTTEARYIALDPNIFRGVRFVRLRSGVSGTFVNQAAARTLTLVAVRPEQF
jgi:hypothetical protein